MASKWKVKKLEALSVDEFLQEDFDSSDDDDVDANHNDDSFSEEDEEEKNQTVGRGSAKIQKATTKAVLTHLKPAKQKKIDEGLQHKASLTKLKDTDPEFYKYLEENDKTLLNFDVSESSEEEEVESIHVPKENLEVASDDSEYEETDKDVTKKSKAGNKRVITMSMVNSWTDLLQAEEPKAETLLDVMQAFRAAVEQARGSSMEADCIYKVESGAIFNAVMRMCIIHLPSALNCLLKIQPKSGEQLYSVSSSKRWSKVQVIVKSYLADLLRVLLVVAEPSIVAVLLKHAYQMVPYITATNKFAKGFLKKLIHFWASGEETVRVLAFMAIVKITRTLSDQFLEFVLKTMYMSFVKNTKFTSPSTWPTINFMKRSLVEIFALDENQAYQYAFVYIRQLAIHLRNAVTVKKKDSIRTVYNWQYIHCLSFWAQLLSSLHCSETLRPLIYPLVQTIIGVIRLVPTARYYPLRFHCVRALILISHDTGTFIPVLPFITEVLEMTDFNKKHTRQSWKPLDFMCMLKLSKVQLTEQGFKDGLIDQLYDLIIEYLNVEAYKIGFPELVLPTVLKLKAFLKKCKVANYCKQIKQILDKIDENSKYINNKRRTVNLNLSDTKAINAWETQQKIQGTPIGQYYATYRKLRDRELLLKISKKDQLSADENLPEVRRRELMEKHKLKDKEDLIDLFAADSDGDDDASAGIFTKKIKTDNADSVQNDKDDDECTDLTSLTGSSEEENDDEEEDDDDDDGDDDDDDNEP